MTSSIETASPAIGNFRLEPNNIPKTGIDWAMLSLHHGQVPLPEVCLGQLKKSASRVEGYLQGGRGSCPGPASGVAYQSASKSQRQNVIVSLKVEPYVPSISGSDEATVKGQLEAGKIKKPDPR